MSAIVGMAMKEDERIFLGTIERSQRVQTRANSKRDGASERCVGVFVPNLQLQTFIVNIHYQSWLQRIKHHGEPLAAPACDDQPH